MTDIAPLARMKHEFDRENRPKPDDLDVYREQLEAFRRKFGRDMAPDDPFFFDPDAETPQFRAPHDAGEILDRITELMAQAGVDGAAIYAFKRTHGLFPTLGAPFSHDELAEWNAAINEYRDQLERGRKQ